MHPPGNAKPIIFNHFSLVFSLKTGCFYPQKHAIYARFSSTPYLSIKVKPARVGATNAPLANAHLSATKAPACHGGRPQGQNKSK
jgi:hypothetical protein